jgi:hypothetical protein
LACKPEVFDYIHADLHTSSERFTFTKNDLWPSGVPAGCDTASAYLFMQYTCEHPIEEKETRYHAVSICVCIGIFISLLFMIWLRSSFQGAKIRALEFDISTLTAGDYTVEMKVKSDDYKYWLNVNPDGYKAEKNPSMSPAYAFK